MDENPDVPSWGPYSRFSQVEPVPLQPEAAFADQFAWDPVTHVCCIFDVP
jgi:hypothetical protein